MSGYIHGAYGSMSDSIISASGSSQSVPLVVGTAPVNLTRGYAEAEIINAPIYVGDMGAKNVIGYSDDWDGFTLCEMMAALFNNENGNIGPAYFINVLNPDVHRKPTQTTRTLTFNNGRAYIESDTIILDTFAIANKTEGVDYSLSYNFTTGKLTIASIDTDNPISGSVNVSFYEVDATSVTDEDIIGNVSEEGIYTGLQAALLVHPNKNAIINYIAIPGYSEHPDVYKAMVEFCQAINNHWYAMPYADIPVEALTKVADNAVNDHQCNISDTNIIVPTAEIYVNGESTKMEKNKDYNIEATSSGFKVSLLSGGDYYSATKIDVQYKKSIDTIKLAKAWQTANGYDSMYTKVFWPQAKSEDKKYHLSSLAIAETLRVDASHNGIPMESCSNKSVPVIAQFFGDNSKNQGFDQNTGNKLNEVGITTMVKWGGTWRLWGSHTAAFTAGDDGNASPDVDPIAIFDTNMRMQEYIINSFEEDRGDEVDKPMDRNLKDTIVEAEQQKLDSLVAQGALIGQPVITFNESENSVSDMVNGNFTWNIADTPTPPAKSLTAKVAYTDAGFTSFFGEEE